MAGPDAKAAGAGKRHKDAPRKRPRVVTLLALILIVSAVFALLSAVTAFGIDAILHIGLLSDATVKKIGVSEAGLIFDGIAMLLSAGVELTVAVGVLRQTSWAWSAAVALAVYDIVTRLWTLATDDFSWPVAIGAAIAVVVLFYLQQDDVKRALGR